VAAAGGRAGWALSLARVPHSSHDMHALEIAIDIAWVVFWIYWLAAAFGAKEGRGSRRRAPLTGLTTLSVLLVVRVLRGGSLAVHSPILGAIGAVVFAGGIALAIWSRVQLGRNWGLPMTQKAEPELITSGPYRFVRHPIYSGLLAGLLGTALVTNLTGLIVVAILGAYFYHCASVEEKNLTATFPAQYPVYRTSTKMLIPFLL
jgi:protein-S-isoprenylcysteine O-methyltransferase Ste14